MAVSTRDIQDRLGRNNPPNNPQESTNDFSGHGSSRTKVSQAVQDVLSQSEQQSDNQRQLSEIQNIIEQLDKEQLGRLIDTLPDSSLSRWIHEIRKDNHANSGLSADQRRDFFNLLSQNLSAEQLQRWETLLPKELAGELADARQQNVLLREHAHSQGNSLDLYSDINQFTLKTAAFSGAQTFAARSADAPVFSEASPADEGVANADEPDLDGVAEQPLEIEEPVTEAFTQALENIALSMPDADPSVHAELAQSFVKLQDTLAAHRAGDTEAPLLEQIKETNELFRTIGNGAPLPTTRRGYVVFTYNSSNLPPELRSMAQSHKENDKEFGEHGWSMRVGLDRMPPALLARQGDRILNVVNGQAAQVRSDQYDQVRGFEFGAGTEAALLNLESQLFGAGAIDQQELAMSVALLNRNLNLSGAELGAQIVNGEVQFSSELLSAAGITESAEAQSGYAWVEAGALSVDDLMAVADTVRTQALETSLDEGGAAKFDEVQRAIAALDTTRSPEENRQLALQGLKLQRSIALTSSDLPSDMHANYQETAELYRAAGLPISMSSYSRGGLFVQFTSQTLPRDLLSRYRYQKVNDRIEYGESGWYVRVPISSLTDEHLVKYAKAQFGTLSSLAAASHLSQIDQFEGFPVSHNDEFQTLIDQAAPVDPTLLPEDTPPLAELLRTFDAASESASSSNDRDYERLAIHSYDVASSLLSDNPENLSPEQLKELHQWVNGTDLQSLGYETVYDELQPNDEWERKSYGPGGNFGVAKMRFAQAWLASSRLERIEYLGISEQRWNQAEMYVGAGLQSEQVARDIRRAEFGLDDIVKIGLALAVGYATGGAASGFVAGALGGTAVSAATTTFLAGAAGGAVGGFSSTLILTDGDIDAALKSGVMGALTGGLTEWAGTLSGSNKVIAEAIISGVASEVSGQDFLDGVLASVGVALGATVANQLKDRMPEFVANFSGKVVELAIRTQGDPDRMQAELEQYVIDYANGRVRTALTRSMGPEYRHVATSLGDLAGVVIASGGDMSKVSEYLESDAFFQSFGNNIGNQVVQSFGGKDNFTAVLSGRITNLVIASRGDMSLIEQGMEGLALSVVGDWADRRMTTLMNSNLSGDERPLAEAMGGLVNVAISSGWNENAVNAFMHGPLVEALGEEGAAAIPERFGGPEGFMAAALEHLTASYSANDGDMDRVAEDMTHFIFGRLIEFHENQAATEPLTLGATGERVTELQDKLREYGFFNAPSTGVFDQSTLTALNGFQTNQIDFLEQQLDTETNITLRGYINEQSKMLTKERDDNEFGIVSSELLTQPYSNAVTPEPSDDVTELAYVHPGLIDSESDSQTISLLQGRLNALSNTTNNPLFNTGEVDGVWGEQTKAGLRGFQEHQLQLLNTALEVLSDVPAERYAELTALQGQLLVDINLSRASDATGVLLEQPFDAIGMNDLVGTIRAGNSALPVNPTAEQLAQFIEQTLNETPESDGLIYASTDAQVSPLVDFFAGQLRFVMSEVKAHPDRLQETIDQLNPGTLELWAGSLDVLAPAEVEEFVELIAENLNAEQLNGFFNEMSIESQDALVDAIFASDDTELTKQFAEVMARERIEQLPMSPQERQSYADMLQVTLDMVGIIDPSGTADLAGAVLAVSRGQFGSALLNLIGLIPWLGDLAKAGKLGSYVKYVDNAVDLALSNPAFKQEIGPLLVRVEEAANAIKHSPVWDGLTTRAQNHLNRILDKIATLGLDASTLPARVIPGVARLFGRNNVTWGFDDLGRTTSVKGDISEIFGNKRSSGESSITNIVGNSTDAGSNAAGGHIAGHRFTGEDTGFFNIVPQNGRRDPLDAADIKNLNQGAYLTFENEVADWVKLGGRVEFDVKLRYTGDSKRPDSYEIVYKVFDGDGNVVFQPDSHTLLNRAGESFQRTSVNDMQDILNLN